MSKRNLEGLVNSDANTLYDVRVTPTGQVYAAGSFAGTLNVDGIEFQSIQSSRDALIISIDPQTGTLLTAELFGGPGGDSVRILKVDSDGRIHAVSYTNSPSLRFPSVSEAFTTDGSDNGFISVFTPVTPGSPPIADAGPSQTGVEDDLLIFDASASSDPDGDTLTYQWDFGDGETVETDTPTVSHAFAYGETFELTLTVLDGNGNSDTATTWATVEEDNDVPVADAGGPYSGTENQPVTFDASQSFDFDNQDGTPANDQSLTYFWDFGDDGSIDATTTEKEVDHVFASAGTYALRLIVDDGVASSESTTTVEITEAPTGIEMYIYDIRFESRRGGKDYRAIVEIRTVFGDLPVQDVAVKVDFAGTSYSLETDGNGIARTSWERKLASGTYYADAYDLALRGHIWDPFAFDLEDDSDRDGKADARLFV